jgi:autotransporter-associated beta strand protein
VIGGLGGLVKSGGGSAMFLTASNAFTGGTSIEAGRLALTGNGSIEHSSPVTVLSTLDVSGRPDGSFNLASGQTLRGTGTINGRLLAKPGSTVSPGVDAIGTLTITNLVTLQGATVMEVDKAGLTQDLIQSSATITYGGTLYLTNLSQGTSPLALGDSFQLFSAPNYAGGFSAIVPSTPGTGMAWDTSQLTVDGTLKVALPRPTIGSIVASGGSVIISGSGGLANGSYYVLASTNIALPLTNWTSIATNTFDGSGNFNFSTPIDPSLPRRFFVLQVP